MQKINSRWYIKKFFFLKYKKHSTGIVSEMFKLLHRKIKN